MDYTLKSVVNFTGPIHDQAEVEAATYRATTDLDDMRETLVAAEAEREAREPLARINNELAPSQREAYARFEAALAAAVASGVDENSAANALIGDPELEAAVSAHHALDERRDDAVASARERAEEAYAEVDHEALIDEAVTKHRRDYIMGRVSETFINLATDGWTSSLWAVVFMAITMMIVATGVSGGIERLCRILMPTLITLMVLMVIYGMFQSGAGRALAFVFKPDASKLEPSGVLEALGHAFFTLSLGMGAIITYGSYQRSKEKIISQSLLIALLDTVIALLACLMIFPIVFSYGQDASAGPGLVFMSMPLAFSEMGAGGMLLAIMFFGLLVFAALTSAVSLLEVVASYFIDHHGWRRGRATLVVGGAVMAVGLLCAFAMDPDFMLASWAPGYGQNFFDTLDYLTSNWMLPLGGLFIAIYAGWVMPAKLRDAEVADAAPMLVIGWLVLVRFVAPALVVVVLLQKVGILDANELFHQLLH